jgi:hypothetical protein
MGSDYDYINEHMGGHDEDGLPNFMSDSGWGYDNDPCDIDSRKKKMFSKKHQFLNSNRKSLNDTLIKLGFKWCLPSHVIEFPPLTRGAVFLDRVDNGFISRLIIDRHEHQDSIVVLFKSKHSEKKCIYTFEDSFNIYYSVNLLAIDFKFSMIYPYIDFKYFEQGHSYESAKINNISKKRKHKFEQRTAKNKTQAKEEVSSSGSNHDSGYDWDI